MEINLNGNTLTNGYFAELVVGEASGWQVLSTTYTALSGNRLQADTSGGAFTVTLPGADQVRTYGLDGLGNWRNSNFTLVGSGGTTTSTAEVRQHNYVNEITSVKDTTGGTPVTTAYAYDHGNNTDGVQGNGNLVNDGVRLYQWDAFNRLIQVSKASDSTVLATYVYDSLGRRIQKTIANLSGGNGGLTGDIPAGTFDYLYDGQQVIEQRNHASPTAWTQVYFWGQYIDELLFFSVPTSTTYRVLSDLLYRSVAIVTTSNVITEAYDTDAYGNTLCYSGAGADSHWFTNDDVRTNNPINGTIFTGRLYDPESQIYYYRARYYSPSIGRFISRDPLKNAELSQGENLYRYVKNNPISLLDPNGLGVLGSLMVAIQQAQNIANYALGDCKSRSCLETCCSCCTAAGVTAFGLTDASYLAAAWVCYSQVISFLAPSCLIGAEATLNSATSDINAKLAKCRAGCVGKPSSTGQVVCNQAPPPAAPSHPSPSRLPKFYPPMPTDTPPIPPYTGN